MNGKKVLIKEVKIMDGDDEIMVKFLYTMDVLGERKTFARTVFVRYRYYLTSGKVLFKSYKQVLREIKLAINEEVKKIESEKRLLEKLKQDLEGKEIKV